MSSQSAEVEEIVRRYERRGSGWKNRFLLPGIWETSQVRRNTIANIFRRIGWNDLQDRTLLDVGCGDGSTLLEFMLMGFEPENLKGIELLPERVAAARKRLPADIEIFAGNALDMDIQDESLDIVYFSLVFTSILDNQFQEELAQRAWNWVKPGGGILWYDFIYDNPKNPDVQGVPMKRVKQLFPEGSYLVRKITLAPPIRNRVCKVHPKLYHPLQYLPVSQNASSHVDPEGMSTIVRVSAAAAVPEPLRWTRSGARLP